MSARPLVSFALAVIAAVTVAASAMAQTPQPAAPAAQANPAEIEFWSTVKDSKNPAELKAYLTTYPNGTFAALARVRIEALEAAAKKAPAAAAPAPAAPPAASTATMAASAGNGASALSTPEIIREVQNKLYNLNYNMKNLTGRLDNETRAAIRQWQGNMKRPQTGDMSTAELDLIRAAILPSTWAAIGYNIAGGSSSHWNVNSRARSEELARDGCKKLKGGNCEVITAAAKGCIVVSYSLGTIGRTRYQNVFAVTRGTQAEAIDVALSECRSRAKVPNNCGVRTTACADGSHKK